jgi:hypothetical protein
MSKTSLRHRSSGDIAGRERTFALLIACRNQIAASIDFRDKDLFDQDSRHKIVTFSFATCG